MSVFRSPGRSRRLDLGDALARAGRRCRENTTDTPAPSPAGGSGPDIRPRLFVTEHPVDPAYDPCGAPPISSSGKGGTG